ncbi:unnamed protein product [Periconia digitata]|uniref:Uncharacterized protein n=1 Tax=Periconia digitata TaxID=1303443 RepID=A0A9W4U4K0_9PLEO|nr:unnamed protein product [Periconia digitata]
MYQSLKFLRYLLANVSSSFLSRISLSVWLARMSETSVVSDSCSQMARISWYMGVSPVPPAIMPIFLQCPAWYLMAPLGPRNSTSSPTLSCEKYLPVS